MARQESACATLSLAVEVNRAVGDFQQLESDAGSVWRFLGLISQTLPPEPRSQRFSDGLASDKPR